MVGVTIDAVLPSVRVEPVVPVDEFCAMTKIHHVGN